MNYLKKALATILVVLVMTMSTTVLAYTGVGDVDPTLSIIMPEKLTEGIGNISGISGTINYQFIEITKEKYDKIKKIEAEYDLIAVYVEYAENPTDETLTNKYTEACSKYESTYNETVTTVYNRYGIGPDILVLCRNAWIVELTEYNSSNWLTSNNSKITLDLTKFEGTRYYIAWIKSGDVYDAEVYKVTGTKTNEPENNVPENNVPENNVPENNVPENNIPENKVPENKVPENNVPENKVPENKVPENNVPENKVTENKVQENKTPENNQKVDNTASDSKVLPHTGASNTIIVLMVIAGVSAVVSYKRYLDIK